MFLILISMCSILLVDFYWVSLVAVSIVQDDLSYFNLQKDDLNLLTIFKKGADKISFSTVDLAIENFIYFSPIFIYFVNLSCWKPHDCFACFNRLPNKRYSIYQYNQEERIRQRDRQYGKGAIRRFEELLSQEQEEQESSRGGRGKTFVEGSE